MNIYYFNITYTCNSNCVFCYSHNTIHSGRIHNEISPTEFVNYLKSNNVKKEDRVIINGGEPFLHSRIEEILRSLLDFGCEVLIYTNGRCLTDYDLSFMTNKYRFVIPVHGHRTLHDSITRCKGSYDAMHLGMTHLNKFDCKVDVKIILNPQMISSQGEFDLTLQDIDSLPFDNAVHITKMADTIISKKNGLPSVSNELAAKFTKDLFDHYRKKDIVIKVFDTCVKDIDITGFKDDNIPLNVYFKDANTEWGFNFYTPEMACRKECPQNQYCQSAVGNYTVLEYNGHFYKGIE